MTFRIGVVLFGRPLMEATHGWLSFHALVQGGPCLMVSLFALLQFMSQGKSGNNYPASALPKPGSQLDSMLGSLQSDLNKLGVATVAKGVCGACKKPIAGQVSGGTILAFLSAVRVLTPSRGQLLTCAEMNLLAMLKRN